MKVLARLGSKNHFLFILKIFCNMIEFQPPPLLIHDVTAWHFSIRNLCFFHRLILFVKYPSSLNLEYLEVQYPVSTC